MSAHAYAAEALRYEELGFVNTIVKERAGAEFDGRDAVVKAFEADHAAVYDGHVDYVEYGSAVGSTAETAVGGIEGGGRGAGTAGIVALGSQSTEGNVVVAGDAVDSLSAVSAAWV